MKSSPCPSDRDCFTKRKSHHSNPLDAVMRPEFSWEFERHPGQACRPTDRRSDDTARGNQPRSISTVTSPVTHLHRHGEDESPRTNKMPDREVFKRRDFGLKNRVV